MSDKFDAMFLWQHEHGSKWITYNAKQLTSINKAYLKGQKTVTIHGRDNKIELLINFDQMYQKNKASGWEQRIRCCVYDDAFYVWQWKDDDGFWYGYLPEISLDLESAYKRNKELKFYYKDDYVCCTKTMKQENVNTGTVREMLREKVKVDMVAHVKVIAEAFASSISAKIESDNANEDDLPRPKKIKLESNKNDENHFSELVPVDPACLPLKDVAHVYQDETGSYNAMLNQTNLMHNNNKFYHIQLLKDNSVKKYYVWLHWGRVGKKGQTNLMPFNSSLESAKNLFNTKFYSKTKNEWEMKNNFVKHPGKYELLKMDYSIEKNIDKKPIKKDPITFKPKNELHPVIMDLIEMIFNVDEVKKKVIEMKYDVNKTPLGKLTDEQIRAGYSALKVIESILQKNERGSKLVEACNDFYTKIPHDFGMKTPPLISTFPFLQEKLELLEALGDIELNMQLQNEGLKAENPIFYYYGKLECDLKVLDNKSKMYNLIETYLQNTHGKTHNLYSMEVVNIFECKKSEEHARFLDYGNKHLLWHGSRLSNFVGILKNGLKIAPPEAPSTGYMFGKGVYFADISSKSANYCYPTRVQNRGLLVLSEVSLGEENILYSANPNANVDTKKKKKHSVKAIGRLIPNPKELVEIDGVKIPKGKPIMNESVSEELSLNYNEYIVYDVRQIKIRYLIHVKFVFK